MVKHNKRKNRNKIKRNCTLQKNNNKQFNIVDVGGGGDCFYRVVAHQLDMNPNNFIEIRCKVADYISKNKDLYLPFFENLEECNNFINSIKKKGNWCEGEIEMQSVCNIYKVDLHVYGDNGNVNKFIGNNSSKTIKMYHEVDVHFKSIVE